MSNFHPDTRGEVVSYLGSLVQSCCGEGGALQANVTDMCGGTRSVLATLGLRPLTGCVLSRLHCSGSRLLYREQALSCVYFPGLSCSGSSFGVLHKGSDSVWPVFCAFPSPSSSGSQELDERTLPGCSVPYHLCGPSLSFHA